MFWPVLGDVAYTFRPSFPFHSFFPCFFFHCSLFFVFFNFLNFNSFFIFSFFSSPKCSKSDFCCLNRLSDHLGGHPLWALFTFHFPPVLFLLFFLFFSCFLSLVFFSCFVHTMTARHVWLFSADNRMDDGRKHESKHCMKLFVQICVDTQRISCGALGDG